MIFPLPFGRGQGEGLRNTHSNLFFRGRGRNLSIFEKTPTHSSHARSAASSRETIDHPVDYGTMSAHVGWPRKKEKKKVKPAKVAEEVNASPVAFTPGMSENVEEQLEVNV